MEFLYLDQLNVFAMQTERLANDVSHPYGLAAQKRLSQKHTLAFDFGMELYYLVNRRKD